ncbi:MAG: hypothetical protein ACRDJE_14115 [Dehalococcoidia bacterium]
MRTIKTTATVNDGGVLTVQVPVDIEPGEYEVAIVVDEQPPREPEDWLDKLLPLDWSAWPPGSTFSRDEIYDDDGR